MKKTLIFLLILTLCLSATVFGGCNDKKSKKGAKTKITFSSGLEYGESDAECIVLGTGTFSGSELAVPDTHNGKPITKISANAFSGQTKIASVSLGDNISFIGENAFADCESVDKVIFRGDVSGWCEIDFENAFANPLSNIAWLYFNDSDTYVSEKMAIQLVFTEEVETIKDYAFYGCQSVNFINVSYVSGIESIGKQAFAYTTIVNVLIDEGVNTFGEGIFESCTNVQNMIVPFVGGKAHPTAREESNLLGYMFGKNEFYNSVLVKQYYTNSAWAEFYLPSSLDALTITAGEIGYGACWGCDILSSVTIGAGVTAIGEYAFSGCTGLTSVSFANKDYWTRCPSADESGVAIRELETANNSQAKDLLATTYARFYWKRTEPVLDNSAD